MTRKMEALRQAANGARDALTPAPADAEDDPETRREQEAFTRWVMPRQVEAMVDSAEDGGR